MMKRTPNATYLFSAFAIAAMMMIGGCQADGTQADAPRSNPMTDEFQAAVDRAPTAQTLYAMSRILISRERDDKAQFVLLRVIEKYPDFLPAYNELAELQMRNDDTFSAMHTLNAGLAVDDENPVLLNNLGVCAMMTEDNAAAITYFSRAHEAAPHVHRYQANLGVALALSGEYDAAFEAMTGVLSETDAHSNLAKLCMANGDEDRAREELRLAEESR